MLIDPILTALLGIDFGLYDFEMRYGVNTQSTSIAVGWHGSSYDQLKLFTNQYIIFIYTHSHAHPLCKACIA
jgi:hypothetical protein